MARVNIAELTVIIDDSKLADTAKNACIDSATLLVDDLTSAYPSDYSETKLKQIELYLSAHFAAQIDKSLSVSSEKFEGASKSYSRKSVDSGQGILSSTYGQLANMISNGMLAELQKPQLKIYTIGGSGND